MIVDRPFRTASPEARSRRRGTTPPKTSGRDGKFIALCGHVLRLIARHWTSVVSLSLQYSPDRRAYGFFDEIMLNNNI